MPVIDQLLKGRLFEWVMTITMLMMALELTLYPAAIKSSAFYWLSRTVGTGFLSFFLIVVGMCRAAALIQGYQIGDARIGAWVRSISAALCSAMWVQFAMSLLRISFENGYPSPGIPLWLNISLGELYIAYRALVNAR